jgi:hypothetical protein
MAPKGSHKGMGRATARAKMPTSVINQRLALDRNHIKGFISEHIRGLILTYIVCGVKDEKAWDLFCDTFFLDPVTTRHFSKFQLMWTHRRISSAPFREWWAAIQSYMGQMFDQTHYQMKNWRWDNPCAFGDQVDCSNPPTTRLGMIKRTGERFSWYCRNDLRAKIEAPSCRQYKPGDFLVVRPLNWDEIIVEDEDDENWADPRAPSGGTSRPGDGNDNDNSNDEEDTQGCESGTGKANHTKDGKGKWKWKATEEGKGKGNGKGHGIVKQTPGVDDFTRAVTFQLQKEMYEANSDMEGKPLRVYLKPKAMPSVSMSSDDATDSTEESDGEFDSELDPDVDMRMEDYVDAPDSVDLDGDVDMERDGDDEVEEDEQEEDEEAEDEDDSKEPRTIGHGEMVNTSAVDVGTMVDDQPIVLPEQGQEMRKYTPRPQPTVPAPRPQTHEPRPQPRTSETPPLSRLEHLRLVTAQKPRPVVPTLQKSQAAGNTLHVDVNQQLGIESAGGDSLSDVSHPDNPLPDVALPDEPHTEARPDGSVDKE